MLPTVAAIAAAIFQIYGSAPDVTVVADPESVVPVSAESLASVQATAADVAQAVQALLPELDGPIRIQVRAIEGDLDPVGGVAGWAAGPGEVQLIVSVNYPGGVASALKDGVRTVLFHEFHHLWRGWTITENQFGPGIPIAAVNEGLAAVFADTYSGTAWERFDYPDEVGDWLQELLELPLDADYNTWMNDHPDGRIAMGYRTGRYIVHQAMARSGLDILELSRLSPEEILAMVRAGSS